MAINRAERGVRRAMGREGTPQVNAGAFRDPRGVAADSGFGVAQEHCDGEEAALHLERRAGTRTAIVVRRIGEDSVCVIQRPAREKQCRPLRQHLVAPPFETAEILPAVRPAGLEARGGADALQPGNAIEERDEPCDAHGQRREPAGAGCAGRVSGLMRHRLHGPSLAPPAQAWDAGDRTCLNRTA